MKKELLALLPAIFLLIASCATAAADQTTNVTVSPSTQTVNVGSTFTVEVFVSPGTEIAGAQFDLSFDPSILEVINVGEGDLFSGAGVGTYFQVMRGINNQSGKIDDVVSVILGAAGVTSPGTMAVITFRAKSPGTSTLTLSDVMVGDRSGDPVEISLSDGSVTVVENPGGENHETGGESPGEQPSENQQPSENTPQEGVPVSAAGGEEGVDITVPLLTGVGVMVGSFASLVVLRGKRSGAKTAKGGSHEYLW